MILLFFMAEDLRDLIPTRQSLLSRLKNWDDRESWQEFFDTYWKLIYGVAIRAGLTDAEAQDVVQETVIQVAKKIPEFKYDPAVGSFKQWLLHTTRWRIGDQIRRRLPTNEPFTQPPADTAETATVERLPTPAPLDMETVWDEEWERNIFEAAIEKVKREVSAKQYQIFDLYVIKKWPVQKVARTLGINIGRVYLAKHRVTGLLKKEIKKLEHALI